jgi:hypothetical protein
MAFFRSVFVDEFGHTVFLADITADNLETAKRQAFVILETPHRMPDSRFSRLRSGKVVPWCFGPRCGRVSLVAA